MTDTTEAAVVDTEPKAPAGHYYVTMKGRRILVKNINTAQTMLIGGMIRQVGNPRSVDDYIAMFGKLMRLVESLIPEPDDIRWLEDGILDGSVDVDDFAMVFLPMTEEKAPKPKRAARRGQ